MFMFDAQGNVCWLQIGTGVFICLAMFMLMFCTTWPTDVFWWVIMSLYKPPEDSRAPIYRWVINLTKWQSVEATKRLFWVVRIPMTKLEHDLPRFHQLAGTTKPDTRKNAGRASYNTCWLGSRRRQRCEKYLMCLACLEPRWENRSGSRGSANVLPHHIFYSCIVNKLLCADGDGPICVNANVNVWRECLCEKEA